MLMRGKRKRSLLFLVLMLIVIAVILRIAVPPLVRVYAPPAISRQLRADLAFDSLGLGLLRGFVSLRGLSIQQPKGFEGDRPLLQIRNISANLATTDLLRKKVRLQEAVIDKLSLHVVRHADGVLNLQQIGPEKTTEPDVHGKPATSPPPPVTLERVRIQEAVVSFSDFSVQPPVNIALTNLNLELTNLQFDVAEAGIATNMPGQLLVTAGLLQPGFTNGYVGISAVIGILGTNIPPVNAALRVVGFDLRSLSGLLPAGVSSAIGGSVLDLVGDASVADDWLRANARIITAGNTLRMGVGGTPRKPDIDKSTALFNLISRPTAFVTKTATGVAEAGLTAGKTVITTAGKAGEGVLGGIVNIGRGATDIAKSATRGDLRGIGDGFVDATAGTVTGVVGSVAGTTRNALEGVGQTLSDATGQSQQRDWQTEVHARWLVHWKEAQDFTATAPYPGMAPR